QIGSGRTILTGANTFSGMSTVTAGVLQIGDGGVAGQITGSVTNNALLVFNRGDAASYGGVISGTGAVEVAGGSVFTFAGANTYSGTTTVSAGILSIGNG